MFRRIKSAITRQPAGTDDWRILREAGYHDVPRSVGCSHARDSADRERLGLQSMGHLR